jgi:two-component system, chemotaxis family, protein-glutamate methylesterase/glutaminase
MTESGLRDVILIGASEGGIHAVSTLLAGLPRPFEAAIAITIHRSPTFVLSELVQVFRQRAEVDIVEPRNSQLFQRRRVYLAPRDQHLEVRHGALWLSSGAKEHHARPAIDVMFRSGAQAYGPRVIGVLLTGNLSDGVAGLIEIKAHGGLSLAQDPAEAKAPQMPQNAINHDDVDVVFRIDSAAIVLAKLVNGESVEVASDVLGAQRLAPRPSRKNAH